MLMSLECILATNNGGRIIGHVAGWVPKMGSIDCWKVFHQVFLIGCVLERNGTMHRTERPTPPGPPLKMQKYGMNGT